MKYLPLLLALISFAVLVFSRKPYTQIKINDNFGVTYVINNNMTLTMEITSKKSTIGWIAIGFGSTNSALMNAPGMEIVRCWTDITTYTKFECAQYIYLEPVNHRAPHLDCSTQIQVLSGYFDLCDGSWQVKFIKPYTTGGNIDSAVKDPSVQINIISAWGKDMETKDVFTYHVGHASVKTSLTNSYNCDGCPFDCDGWTNEGGTAVQNCVERNKLYLNTSAPFSIYYSLYPSLFPNTLSFQVQGKHSGYVLIGFGKSFTQGTDGLLINYDSQGNAACTDVTVKGFGLENDARNDCKVEASTKRTQDNMMDITVSRKLRTGESGDFVLKDSLQPKFIQLTPTDIVVTYGPSDTFDYFRQTAILEQFLFDSSRVCTYECDKMILVAGKYVYGCTGPEENQCSGQCNIVRPEGTNSCYSYAPEWENAVLINDNFTLFYNINDKSKKISLRVRGRNVPEAWFGIAFSKTISDTNVLVVSGKMDYIHSETLKENRVYDCQSMSLKSMKDFPVEYESSSTACQCQGNSYYDNGGVDYFFLRDFASTNPKEYQLKVGEKQNWALVIGASKEKSAIAQSLIEIPEFTLSGTKISCNPSCTECISGVCTKCPAGKEVYQNTCVDFIQEKWNYFTIPSDPPVEGAYTLWFPTDGTRYLNVTAGFIQFNFTVKELGWFGMGVGKTMLDADIFVIHKNGNSYTCTDMISKARSRPAFDEWLSFGNNDCQLLSIQTSASGFTSASIRRPLQFSDSYDKSISKYDVPRQWLTDFIWALHNSSQTFTKHQQKGQIQLNITIEEICHPSCSKGCSGPKKDQCYPDDICTTLNYLRPDSNMTIYYYFCNEKIVFRALGLSKGWLGLGFGDGMTNVDMLVISFGADGKANCTDYWSTAKEQPKSDVSLGGSNDCTIISGSRKDGIIDVWFSRPVKARDPKYDTEIKEGVKADFSVAYGETDVFKQHISEVEIKSKSLDRLNCTANGCAKCPQISECLCTPLNKLALNSNFTLYYRICQDDVIFRAVGTNAGWFGLAFGKGMINMDMLMINFTNNVANCYDLWSTNASMPAFDTDIGGTNDCRIINGTRNASGFDVWFLRPAKATNQKWDSTFQLGAQNISFAFGSSDTFQKHKEKNYSQVQIGGSQACSTNCTTCSGPEENDCHSCKSGFKLMETQCIQDSGNSSTRLVIASVAFFLLVVFALFL